jgi:hypothetical protein
MRGYIQVEPFDCQATYARVITVSGSEGSALCQPPNKHLQRTVTRRRGDDASAPFHYALAPRFTRQRAAAELRR